MKKLALVLLICFLLVLPVQAASPGEPDITFGEGGFDFDVLPDYANWTELVVDANGRIVVAGTGSDANAIYVARFTPDGMPDLSFGSNGVAAIDPESNNMVTGLLVDSAGRIIVAGNSYSGIDLVGRVVFVGRLLDTGVVDVSFNNTGITYLPYEPAASSSGAAGIALTPDDKIVMMANLDLDLAVIRLNTDGTLDTSFGNGGNVLAHESDWIGRAVLVSMDGKITLVSHKGLMRFNIDGTLDTTFDGDGKVVVLNSDYSFLDNAAFDASGKLVLIGRSDQDDMNFCWSDVFLMRYTVDGSLDSSFGNAGEMNHDFEGCVSIGDMLIDGSGKFTAVGSNFLYSNMQQQNNMLITRFNPDGALDTGFGTNGITTHHFTANDQLIEAALQGDKIMALGYNTVGGSVLARYHSVSGGGDNLLVNGSFEIDADSNKVPDGWQAVNASSDRLRCNTADSIVAAHDQCAYRFENSAAENSKLTQTPVVSDLKAGDQLSLIAYVRAKGSVNIKVTAQISYSDGTTEKMTLRLKKGTQKRYEILQETLTLSKDVVAVKVTVINRSTTGRSLLDGVQLVHLPAIQGGLLPLPPVPGN